MANAIAADGLSKRFGAHTAVDRVSLRVAAGEIYGFVGLNGAGKTTTIRMLLGMVRPTAGSVELLGQRAHAGAHALWARVGYLVERPAAYPDLTVRDNLELARRLRQVTDRRAVDRAIERLGLDAYADRSARTLSLGNAQRLALTKALLHDPEVLILDEPTNGLDPAGVVEVRELLRRLACERGVTVFLSSHILGEVARLAKRIGILHGGRLIDELDAANLNGRHPRALLVDARDREAAGAVLRAAGFAVAGGPGGAWALREPHAIDHPDAIARLLVGAGVAPTRLALDEEDLETQFLRRVHAAAEGGA